jgi:MFS family permease
LSTGIGIVAVSTGLAGMSQSYEQLLILRGIGGVGSAMFTVSATALLLRVVSSTSRGRATGLFQSGFLIGGVLGPLFGGYLTDYSVRLPFYVYAVSLIAAGSIGAVFLKGAEHRIEVAELADADADPDPDPLDERAARVQPAGDVAADVQAVPADAGEGATEIATPVADGQAVQSTTLAQAWAHPSYRAAIAVNFAVGWALFGIRASLVPLFVTEAMGLRPVWTGYGFLCSALAQVAALTFAGRYVDRAGRRPAMVIGTVVVGLSLVVLAMSSALPVFLLSMTAIGVGGAFIGTAPGAVVGDIIHGRSGRVVAVFGMAMDAGAISGPLIAGWLADQFSFSTAFAACSVAMFVAAAFSLRMPETLAKK